MKSIIVASGFALIAASAVAGDVIIIPPPNEVPEIDTLSGLAALAAVGGAVTLLWERRKKK